MEIINGKELAQIVNNETMLEVSIFKNKYNRPPKLVAILVGNNPASQIYVTSKQKKCKELGIDSAVITFAEDSTEKEIISAIENLNSDKQTDAILLQLPLPKQLDENKILNYISPIKDVDGLTNINLGSLLLNNDAIAPCTAKGVLKMLENENLEGKNAVVIGRSKLVGKPTAILLEQQNATVTLCHSKTTNLQQHINNADILVVAVGKPKYISKVKPGAIVIDVGINRTDKGLCGDIDFEKVSKQAGKISPVPGGVGPLTIAMLMKNTLQCAYKNIK